MNPARICMHTLSPAIGDARIMREATALVEAGYDVSIVDIEHDRSRPTLETERGVVVDHVFFPERSRRYYSAVNTLPWLWFKIERIVTGAWKVVQTPADAYHAHDITALPACVIAATLRRKPLIFDAHELPITQNHLLRWPLVAGISRALLRLMMMRCTHAITVSPHLIGEMKRLYGGPTAALIRNVPNYRSPSNEDRLRRHFDLSPDTRIALYQGYFQGNRSLDVLVRAAQFLRGNTVIVLLGKGPDLPDLEKLIETLGVGDRIKIKDYVPNDELLSWTASANIGLCLFSRDISASLRYCLPNKLFEYLMAGLPVLTTPLDSVVDLLRRYDAGREVSSMDPPAIAAAIEAMLADVPALDRMRVNALNACEHELRWDLEAKELQRFYADVFRHAQPAATVTLHQGS